MNSPQILKHLLTTHKIDILIDYLPNADYFDGSDLIVKTFGKFDTCFACSQDFFNTHDYTPAVTEVTPTILSYRAPGSRRYTLTRYSLAVG